jgi:hypothetical protein
MKKLYLLVFTLTMGLTVSSCSEETTEPLNKPYGEMTFVVDDVQKAYNNVQVTEYVNSAGEKFLNVVGSNNGVPGEYLAFRIKKYQTGSNLATRWAYSKDSNLAKRMQVDGVEYNLDSHISLNSDNRLRGTFSGKLYNEYSNIVVTIDEGEFIYNFNLPE